MPIYEYQCRQCAHQFEYLVLRTSAAAKCPGCESEDLEQLVSMSAFRSESTSHENLAAAHRKVAAARGNRMRDEHRSHHEHFEDPGTKAND